MEESVIVVHFPPAIVHMRKLLTRPLILKEDNLGWGAKTFEENKNKMHDLMSYRQPAMVKLSWPMAACATNGSLPLVAMRHKLWARTLLNGRR